MMMVLRGFVALVMGVFVGMAVFAVMMFVLVRMPIVAVVMGVLVRMPVLAMVVVVFVLMPILAVVMVVVVDVPIALGCGGRRCGLLGYLGFGRRLGWRWGAGPRRKREGRGHGHSKVSTHDPNSISKIRPRGASCPSSRRGVVSPMAHLIPGVAIVSLRPVGHMR